MPGGSLWVWEAPSVTFGCESQINVLSNVNAFLREAQSKKGLS